MLFSQNTRSAREFFSLKITPTALLNPSKPTLLLGVEFKPKPKLGLHIEHGFQVPSPYEAVSSGRYYYERLNRRYSRTKIEVRRHTFHGWRASHYQAFGLMNFFENYDTRFSSLQYRDGRRVSYSSAKIFRSEWAGYFLFGSKIWSSDHVYTDIYAGIGYKRITIDYGYVNVTAIRTTREVPEYRFLDGDPGHRFERSVGQPYIDFGIKVGYSF